MHGYNVMLFCLMIIRALIPIQPLTCNTQSADVGHEATVSKINDEQIFYLMSRGLSEAAARALIVNGFIDAFVKELPMEYAVEINRLIAHEMEGSIG